LIEEIQSEYQGKSNPIGEDHLLSKTKGNNLLINLKKQLKELEVENRNKDCLIDELKKNFKTTKINELQVELKTYFDEITRLKSSYNSALERNILMEENLKNFNTMQGIANNKNIQLNSLEEARKSLESELVLKSEELYKLRIVLKQKDDKILKLTRENKMFKDVLHTEKKEEIKKVESVDPSAQNKLQITEKKLANLKKDLGYYKDLYE
jgi:hypothetical protein